MEINRNQYFMCGLVLLMLGMQFRYVDSFVLNKHCSEILDKQLSQSKPEAQQDNGPDYFAASTPSLRRVKPPKWIGWAMISVGGVLVFHSLAMRRPD